MKNLRLLLVLLLLVLAGCAAGERNDSQGSAATLGFQNPALNPRNGGTLVGADALLPGDILLSSGKGLTAAGIQLLTLGPVSHAALYVGDGEVAEAVGEGIRSRRLADVLNDEAVVVAFRHPAVNAGHMQRMRLFVSQNLGNKYNLMGVVLQAPFSIERRVCELPLVPPPVRDFCIQGIAAVQLGMGRNDIFFCSQFVLEAYRRAGIPLTDADPRLVSPADLLHMREGDVPSVRIHQALQYVGHLKFQP
ncbi:MAG: distant relative of cell wall-associated hydrolase [Burkholderiales bacterium]|nr:distant relative of cell wall-associated hydrolase [Burkholderiales bacterium]